VRAPYARARCPGAPFTGGRPRTFVTALIGVLASATCILAAGTPVAADPGGDDGDWPVVNGCTIKPFTECEGADLSGADLREAPLFHADLHGANLSRADLSDA
jgi:hypothetical protein